MGDKEIEIRLAIGVVTPVVLILVLIWVTIRKRKKAIPINQKIFGEVFLRSMVILFPAIAITAKDIYEFLIIVICLIFATILNTQYFLKMYEAKKEDKK